MRIRLVRYHPRNELQTSIIVLNSSISAMVELWPHRRTIETSTHPQDLLAMCSP